MGFAGWLQAQWFSKAKKHRGFWIAVFFLWPLHGLFLLISGLRQLAYQRGWLKTHRLPIPVIVVGNLIVGGAGKTPLTLWLAEQLMIRGIKPGIVSRGYGGQAGEHPVPVFPDSDPAQVGDEPVLLAMRTRCPVWIARRRVEAAHALLAASPETQIILCDDGLQHLALGRDAEVVVFDERGAGNGWRMPLGPLREPLCRLQTVDALVLNGAADHQFATLAPGLPVFPLVLRPGTFYRLGQPEVHCSAEELITSGKLIHAVSGIGHPARFFATLNSLGLTCIEHSFPDHHAFQLSDLEFAERDTQGKPGIILMTEKDAVKCASFYRGEAWVLPVEAHIPSALADILLEKIHGRTSA